MSLHTHQPHATLIFMLLHFCAVGTEEVWVLDTEGLEWSSHQSHYSSLFSKAKLSGLLLHDAFSDPPTATTVQPGRKWSLLTMNFCSTVVVPVWWHFLFSILFIYPFHKHLSSRCSVCDIMVHNGGNGRPRLKTLRQNSSPWGSFQSRRGSHA